MPVPSVHGERAGQVREAPARRRGSAAEEARRAGGRHVATLEDDYVGLTDDGLRQASLALRERVANGEALDDVLYEAFALVREARKRESGQRLFDVQMMGAIVLHEGDIAEMRTGEGKTFVASLALYLNALSGENVHLVTVNDYLAKRDAEWNLPVYERLGVTVGYIQNMMPFADRQAAYACDITYGTNSEFGFDYLRDNMAVSLDGDGAARAHLRDRGRGRLDPRRRGAHAADHLRRARDRGEDVLRLRPGRQASSRASRRTRRSRRARTRPSSRAPTSRTTRSSRPSRRRRWRSRRSSGRSGSTTSTTRATCSSSTTSTRR